MSETTELRTYFQDGVRWEEDIVRKANRSRALAWFFAMLMAVLACVAVIALLMLVPLKSFEPVIVEVDKNTGYIEVKSGLTKEAKLSDRKAVSQANIVHYIRAREGYDPYAIEENFGKAALFSTAEAAKDLQGLWSSANTANPARKFGKSTRVLVDVKSVTFPNETTALVRFSTDERTQTDSIVRHYISVVRFRYTSEPARNEWRFDNPLGFQVYSYRRDQETTSPEGK